MEYGVLVATFVAIMALGLELGIAAGIVGASLLFAYNYSKVCCLPSSAHAWPKLASTIHNPTLWRRLHWILGFGLVSIVQ